MSYQLREKAKPHGLKDTYRRMALEMVLEERKRQAMHLAREIENLKQKIESLRHGAA